MRRLRLTYGIEEEYFLVDPETRNLAESVPDAFLRACRRRFGDRIQEEMQRPQIEFSSPILHSPALARECLNEHRAGLDRIAHSMGMRMISAGTHPTASWDDQRHTSRPRYDKLIHDYQMVGRRNLLSALHVHVAIPDGIDRVALMNRLMPWLPFFLALSTSSPFWNGRFSGLLSYRQAAYDEWPRSGIPDAFDDQAQYDSFIDLLSACGAVADGSYLWWAIRPSASYPTLELRICDACTRVEDALAIAAGFRCLVRAHIRNPDLGSTQTPLTRRVIDENRWRAKRYGTSAAFIDEQRRAIAPFAHSLQEFSRLVGADAQALGHEQELQHLLGIAAHGSSAHTQMRIYRRHREAGSSREESLLQVVDWLAQATLDPGAPRPSAQAGRAPATLVDASDE